VKTKKANVQVGRPFFSDEDLDLLQSSISRAMEKLSESKAFKSTLRDQFARSVATASILYYYYPDSGSKERSPKKIAKTAYEIADALMTERAKTAKKA